MENQLDRKYLLVSIHKGSLSINQVANNGFLYSLQSKSVLKNDYQDLVLGSMDTLIELVSLTRDTLSNASN